MNQFQIISKAGQGSFACVYKVKRKEDGKIYALKKIKIYAANDREISNALNEVRILASVSNSYIIGYKEAFYEEVSGCLCLVTEFAEGGDLSAFINSHRKKGLPVAQQQIWKIAIQLLHGLKALHQKNIFHRDIKSANIFMTKKGEQIKLGDMNVSVISKNGMASTQTGTPYYTSPQVWKDLPYNGKCDVWSMGCVLYEMTCFHTPFLANDINSLKKKVILGLYERIPRSYSEDLENFIRTCLTTNIYDRPNIENLLHCSYIRKRIHLYPNEKFNLEAYDNIDCPSHKLLKTIRTPFNKNFKGLKDQLPKSNYKMEDFYGENKENIQRNRSGFLKDEHRSLQRRNSGSECKLPRIQSKRDVSCNEGSRKADYRSAQYGNLPRPLYNHYR